MSTIPKLIVLIHTEEEFDWNKPFSRESIGTDHVGDLLRYQQMFSDYGASVAYALTYPMASNASSAKIIKKFLKEYEHTYVGLHCHPWVNPPYTEEVNSYNSYPGNLPINLEREKLINLYEVIKKNIGHIPNFYLAGRYGVGKNTNQILNELDLKYDFSAMPHYDYSHQEGPNFSDTSTRVTTEDNIIKIPHTSGFTGWTTKGGEKPSALNYPLLVKCRFTSFLSLLGGFNQVILNPEGFSITEMKALTRKFVESNHTTLVLSFHSPSVKPGLTPYVKTHKDAELFFEKLDKYMQFYTKEVCGEYLLLN